MNIDLLQTFFTLAVLAIFLYFATQTGAYSKMELYIGLLITLVFLWCSALSFSAMRMAAALKKLKEKSLGMDKKVEDYTDAELA